jgi:hypothetical protein
VHLFVAIGDGTLDDGTTLHSCDGARLTGPQQLRFTAGSSGAELLVWATA